LKEGEGEDPTGAVYPKKYQYNKKIKKKKKNK
jgi:hypothetical protein